MSNKDKLLINGPLNAFRLEGSVNGNKKVLYMFCDVHKPVTMQTQCPGLRSVEFKEYLVKSFDALSANNADNKVE